jgi:hypothetical protein
MKSNDPLDELFAAVRAEAPDTERAQFGFETRLLARIREERSGSWFSCAWKLSPYFAALALVAGAWGYANYDVFPDGESVTATLQQGGLSVLEYYLGGDE